MKRPNNADGSNSNSNKAKLQLAASKSECQGKKTKGKKKAAVGLEAIEDNGEERKIGDINGEPILNSHSASVASLNLSSSSSLEGWEEYGAWLRGGVVDEQMSWGSSWMPVWDVEYMGEACGEMFSDVMWDDDIWNLKNMDKMPNP